MKDPLGTRDAGLTQALVAVKDHDLLSAGQGGAQRAADLGHFGCSHTIVADGGVIGVLHCGDGQGWSGPIGTASSPARARSQGPQKPKGQNQTGLDVSVHGMFG